MNDLSRQVTIVQNYVCTSEERKKTILENLPKMSKIFEGFDFLVSYNTEKNFEELKDAYEKNIPNVKFTYSDRPDWGLDSLDLLKSVSTPYVIYLCEDFDFVADKQVWRDTLKEVILQEQVDFMMLAKTDKYVKRVWHKNYHKSTELAHYYTSNNSPSYVISVDALYRTDFFKERLTEYTELYSHHLPNNYETYYKHDNSLKRFDLQCCIPSTMLVFERHPGGKVEASRFDLNPNKPLGEKNAKSM